MTEKIDPELLDDSEEGVGDESAYDGEAVEYFDYDHSQFELPEDYEVEEDEGDEE